jgi:hypothetical protein
VRPEVKTSVRNDFSISDTEFGEYQVACLGIVPCVGVEALSIWDMMKSGRAVEFAIPLLEISRPENANNRHLSKKWKK